jgi:phospholipid/cholesterol/gamma-HCH transport system ATP-binding protein
MAMTSTSDALVKVRGLSFRYGARKIFENLSLDIRRGAITAIIGPSGIGKSTLLALLGGQLRPDAGTIEFDGVDVHALSRRDLFELRKRMGMMFQAQALLTDISVFDNVAFPLREHTPLPESMIHDIVIMKLQLVGLRAAAPLFPAQLSGGMARRVALARAIALDPDLVMYDEPFAGLDPIGLGTVMRVIRTLSRGLASTGVVVSHSVDEVLAVSDDVYVLGASGVLDHGTPEEIRRSESDAVQQILTGQERGPVPFHYPAPPIAEELLSD